jgi:hypothetical protein
MLEAPIAARMPVTNTGIDGIPLTEAILRGSF